MGLYGLIELCKKSPGKYTFGSAGSGTTLHLSGELFKMLAKVDIVHVPYRGSAPATQDLLAGQISMMFDNIPGTLTQSRAGKVRPLGVTSLQRFPLMQDVPTIAEQGLPGFEAISWAGICAPGGTPKPIIDRLHAELVKSVNDAEVKDRLIANGMDFVGSSPSELADVVKRDFAKWSKLVKETGLKAD